MDIKGRLSRWIRRQRGSAMTETLVSLPLLLLLGLGGLQTALLYDAKTTLNYATFEAARIGAVSHAQSDAMREELGLRLAPLFGGDGSMRKAMAAITRASLDVRDKGFTQIEIINPTIEAFDEFGRDLYDPRTDEVRFGIPNGHLRWRSRSIGSSGVNIQDANLLKIKVTYGYKLRVPLMDRLIPALMSRIDPQNFIFYTVGRIPITSVATVRMQSAAWRDEGNIHAEGHGGGATPPAGEEETGEEGSVPDDEAGQGGDDDAGDDDEATPDDENDVDDDTTTDDDDLPSIIDSIGDGDDQGGPVCENPANPTAQSSGIAGSHTGNPIHVVTGNKYQQETDLTALPGTLGLVFSRHYNSHSDYTGPLGHGWRHSYDVHLQAEAEGYRLRQSDGRVIRFQATETPGHYTAPRLSDGWLRVNDAQLTWHWRNGQQLQFNPQGQLRYIVHPAGQTQSLYYNPQDALFLVRDPQGRTLGLDHYPNGRIKALHDPAGQVTRYRYDEAGNLAQVTRPNGSQRLYHYDDPHDRHNLTSITDERGVRYAAWAYDAQDRAILSTHADQVGQVKLDFSTAGETRVTDSQGKLSTYSTEIRDGVARVTAIHGPGCSSCGKGDVSYRYNERLQLTEITTRDGITKRYSYDAQGRTTAVTRQTLDTEPQPIARYEYADDTALKPSAVIRPSVNPQGERRIDYRYNPQGQATQITERGYRPEADGGYTPIERTTRLAYTNGQLTVIEGPREAVKDL
ncbi:MAG: pilus assembly protein, partial [Candidatus Thiodiazotropha sp. (ex Epidulcina cf. delphinae)]|nr:pilus assembly protein [Candidatus Thiodiazotropha sp. (ex Epidulcina cf. delphinae)]